MGAIYAGAIDEAPKPGGHNMAPQGWQGRPLTPKCVKKQRPRQESTRSGRSPAQLDGVNGERRRPQAEVNLRPTV